MGFHSMPLKSFVKSETRASLAASGDVSYTGYGFKPTSLEIIMATDLQDECSIGFVDSAETEGCMAQRDGTTNWVALVDLVAYQSSAGNKQTAVLKSYDADGFSLTWTKLGNPANTTMRLLVRAFR